MTEPIHRSGCLVCGKELVYSDSLGMLTCFYCGKEFPATVACPEGHFVCDACHETGAMDLIEEFCSRTEIRDPVKIANILMRNPKVTMHGPEHHFLVPAALLAAYYNVTGDEPSLKQKKIRIARARASQVPGGFCGSHGNCGAAVGTGIFISLITGATPLSNKEWQLSNMVTARSLEVIAIHGGPRCCKRNTYFAIAEAARFLKEIMNTPIRVPERFTCGFNQHNRECLKTDCIFFP
jgi:hypothetical protein